MASATIRDVARSAAVSVASASRALNGHPSVSGAVRERVREAATRLRYVPHAAARSLSLAKAHAIGVVLPDLHGEFFSELLRGMDRGASAAGYQLLLSNMHADPEQAARALASMRGRVDGLLVMAPHLDAARVDEHVPARLPAVFLHTADPSGAHPGIAVANAAGSRLMVRHLADQGCRRIVHIAGAAGNIDATERAAGYRTAMAELGLDAFTDEIAGDFTEEAGGRAAQVLLRRGALPDAIYAANDAMAIGCLLALRDAGVHAPDQVAIAGFDDIPAARFVSPALTTLRVDIAEVGARAVALLVALMHGGEAPRCERLMPTLMTRATTLRINKRGNDQ